jgi:hypothetical protein
LRGCVWERSGGMDGVRNERCRGWKSLESVSREAALFLLLAVHEGFAAKIAKHSRHRP